MGFHKSYFDIFFSWLEGFWFFPLMLAEGRPKIIVLFAFLFEIFWIILTIPVGILLVGLVVIGMSIDLIDDISKGY